jgi:alpha-ketoglutarate-dependent taurine dioxygenase
MRSRVPRTGGNTQFTNMDLAYVDQAADVRALIDDLKVVHKYDSSRKGTRVAKRSAAAMAEMPDAVHPSFVRTRRPVAVPFI